MSDNRTTEKRISESLRGFIRHQSNRAYIDGGQARWLTKIADEIDAKHEQAIAATLGGDDKTRWHELFGSPERAARTLAGIACEDGVCEGCSLYGAHCTYDGTAQLEWLRGDA